MRWNPLRDEGWPSPPLLLLLRAALSGEREARDAWASWLASNTIDRASDGAFFLLPAVYANVRKFGRGVPEIARLRGIRRQACARNQLAIRTFAKATEVLEAADIESIALKGLPLALLHYENVGDRLMYDVDLLVAESQWANAATALRAAGWALPKPIPSPDFVPFAHAVACVNPNLAELDLHDRPFPFQENKDAELAFRARAIPAEAHGLSFRVPDPTDLLLLVTAHGRRGDSHSIARWVVDALMILRSAVIEWDEALDRATELGVFLAVRDALTWLANFTPGSIPAEVLARAWSHPVPFAWDAAYANLVRGLTRQNLWASHRWRYKTGAIASRQAPSIAGYANYVLRFYQYAWDLPGRSHVPWALLGHAPRYLRKKWEERQNATHLPLQPEQKGV